MSDTITFFEVHPVIGQVKHDSSGIEREQIERVIRSSAADIAWRLTAGAKEALAMARRKLDRLRDEQAEIAQSISEAEADEKLGAGGSRSKAWIYGAAGLTCGIAEFAMSYSTLPWALGIRQESPLGVSVALAPVAAMYPMKEALDRLIRPAYRAILAPTGTLANRAIRGAEIFFLVGMIVGGGFATLAQIANTRELAINVSQLLGAGAASELTAEQQALLAKTVLAITLYTTLAGAACWAYANVNSWGAQLAKKARKRLSKLRAERDAKGKEIEAAAGEHDRAAIAADLAPIRAGQIEEQYVSTQLVYLARSTRPPPAPPAQAPEPLTFDGVSTALNQQLLAGRGHEARRVNGRARGSS